MRKTKILTICTAAVLGMAVLTGCGDSTKKTFEQYAECADVNDYIGVEYVPASREVTQEEIDEAISSFCQKNSVTEQDTTSAVAEDDYINVDYVETINGAEYASKTSFNMTMGYGVLGEDVDEQLVGAVPGDVKVFSVSYPEDYSDIELAGLTAEFEVTINYISVTTVPEYDDALVSTATGGEYTSTEDYTAYLTENLQQSKNDSADSTDKTSVLQTIINNTTFVKYPEDEINDYVVGVVEDLRSTASGYGIDFETYLYYFYGYTNAQDYVNYLSQTVISVMKEKIVVMSIALDQDLIATDDDVAAYKEKIMNQSGIAEEDIATYFSDEDLLFYATEVNVLDYLLENAVAVDELEEDTESDTEGNSEVEAETTAE